MDPHPPPIDPRAPAPGTRPELPARQPRPPTSPHSQADVEVALWNPLRTVDVVLATPERVAANVDGKLALGRLAFMFLVCGLVFAIPYSCVLGLEDWWRVTTLYLGSTLICLPSLFVFTSYMGTRVSLAQIVVLALMIPASAALFTLGFAPILEFLRLTMGETSREIGWASISKVLLGISLAAGVIQLWRCFLGARQQTNPALLALVLVVWHGVFLYVFSRMFSVLGL